MEWVVFQRKFASCKHMKKCNALNYFMASLGMLLSLERTEQKIWVLIILSLVTDASAASLTQGTVMMVVWQHLWFLSSLLQAVLWAILRSVSPEGNCYQLYFDRESTLVYKWDFWSSLFSLIPVQKSIIIFTEHHCSFKERRNSWFLYWSAHQGAVYRAKWLSAVRSKSLQTYEACHMISYSSLQFDWFEDPNCITYNYF